LAVVDIGGCGSGTEDALGFQVGLHVLLPPVMRFVVLLGPNVLRCLSGDPLRDGGRTPRGARLS
jgi:hypothetical protein